MSKKRPTHFDFLSVQTFSRVVGAHTAKVTRYAKLGLLPPAFRSPKGVQYFAPAQANRFHLVRLLLSLGMSIDEIKGVMETGSPDAMLDTLLARERAATEKIDRLRREQTLLHVYEELYTLRLLADEERVFEVKLMELRHFEGPPNPQNQRQLYRPFAEFCEALRGGAADGDSPIRLVAGGYEDFDAFAEDGAKPSRYCLVDPEGDLTRPAGNYLLGFSRADGSAGGDLPKRLAAYAEAKGAALSGPVWTGGFYDSAEAGWLYAVVLMEE